MKEFKVCIPVTIKTNFEYIFNDVYCAIEGDVMSVLPDDYDNENLVNMIIGSFCEWVKENKI